MSNVPVLVQISMAALTPFGRRDRPPAVGATPRARPRGCPSMHVAFPSGHTRTGTFDYTINLTLSYTNLVLYCVRGRARGRTRAADCTATGHHTITHTGDGPVRGLQLYGGR